MDNTGKVKWYSEADKYGFITKDNGGSIYFQKNGLIGQVDQAQLVSFIIDNGTEGPRAVYIQNC